MSNFSFEIRVESYIAKVVMFNVMNNYIENKEAVALYRKACKQHKTGSVILETADEIRLWNKMLITYQPKTTEEKVYNAMLRKSNSGIDIVSEYEC